ncbi:uncharacterized protein TNCV_263171 [Trichonephila clavipes]|nr:uncharacterized protein TNCV_263171 [Trichonephila clavipes]
MNLLVREVKKFGDHCPREKQRPLRSPQAIQELPKDSPTVNVYFAVSSSNVFSLFFLVEKTVTGINYLDMLKIFLMTIIKGKTLRVNIFQLDGSPCQYHNDVTFYLNVEVLVWIDRGGAI